MNPLTVIIPTSPISSNPSTEIIEETVGSIRERTAAEIWIMCDGVRAEQADMNDAYQLYLFRLLGLCRQWDAMPFLFGWRHQAGITHDTLAAVETPCVLFVEHDTPLIGQIPFDRICNVVESGAVNVVRFYHEAAIHPEHASLMIGSGIIEGVPLTFTKQYSQRPMIINTAWYRRIFDRFFTEKSRCFIEDRLHSPAQTEPWGDWRLAIYSPDEPIIKRSTHTNGRAGGPKFDESQVW